MSLYTTFLILLSILAQTPKKINNLNNTNERAINGIIDLRGKNIETNTINLNGYWLFAWQSYIHEFDVKNHHRYIYVPGEWENVSEENIFNKGLGYGTYGIKILLPKGKNEWALYIPPIHSAYRLYINGDLQLKVGELGTNDKMKPKAKVKILNIDSKRTELKIIIQVSNFNFGPGGIWSPLIFGTQNVITSKREQSIFFSAFLIGSLVMMGLYHIIIYLFRWKNKSPLYFSIICFLFSLRETFGQDALIYEFFPNINYEFSIKLLYQIFPSSLIALVYYYEEIYKKYSSKIKTITKASCLIYLGLIVFTNAVIFPKFLNVISLLFIINSIHLISLILKTSTKNSIENTLNLYGILVLILCLINDVLFEQAYINTSFLLPLGLFIFILCQSVIIGIRYSEYIKQTEILSVKLSKSNNEISEMTIKQQQLEEKKSLEEMKNRFFSSITHEFRTPITLIISPIERLLEGSMDQSLQIKTLRLIQKSANHLLILINQILDLAKMDAKRMEVVHSQGNIIQFIKDLVYSFNFTTEEKGISIELISFTQEDEYIFDADKIEKICYNIISNAIKFTKENGKIVIKLEIRETILSIEISDTGSGIAKDKLAYIFDRFYQINNSLTRVHEGTGIGLSLVKELVDILNGEIEVGSTLGIGTTFRIRIPISKVHKDVNAILPKASLSILQYQENPADKNEDMYTNVGSPKILLVEDNVDLIKYIKHELTTNYYVFTAKDGEEGWEICQQELPDLVISDIMMPNLNGFELCSLIKNNEMTSHVGVILLTAKAASDSKMQGLSLGANDYVPKPFHFEELNLRIKNFFTYQNNLKSHYSKRLTGFSKSNIDEGDHPFMVKVYEVIEKNIDDPQFSIVKLSQEMAVSHRTLNRKLAAIIGLTPNEVIRRYRLKKAAETLLLGSNISETAYQVGFESPSYFGHCFKEIYKVTPSEFINRHSH